LKLIEALDDDFQVFWSRNAPPTKAAIDLAEKKLGAKLRDDHRAMVRTMGCGAVLAKEDVWPRAKELEVRPMWQFFYGVEIFGVTPDTRAPAVDVVVQAKDRAPSIDGCFVPAIRRIGERRCVGYDKQGKLFEWAPGEEPSPASTDDLLGILREWLQTLVADKDKMKRAAVGAKKESVRVKSAKSSGGGNAVDEWLERLANDKRGDEAKAFRKAPKSVRDGVVTRVLEATDKKKIDRDMIWRLADFGGEARAIDRMVELTRHKVADVRDAAVTVIAYVEPLPKAGLAALIAALEDKNEDVRNSAAEALEAYASSEAIEPLLKALARERKKPGRSGISRDHILEALGACGNGRADVVDLLVSELSLKDRYATLPAFKALITMGKKAKRAIPALEALLTHEDPYREMHARHALAFITGDPKPHLARLKAGTKIKDAGGATAASAKIALQEIDEMKKKKKKS
jgi:HEAT repeat protein